MASVQLVVFKLASEEYAVPIAQVKEILRFSGATKLPNTPEHLEGVISLRGKVIPVVDLAKHFGMAFTAQGGKQVIIVEAAGREVGIVVDSVTEVLRIEEGAIDPVQTLAGGGEYLRGIGKLDKRLLIILDLHKVFGKEEQALLQAARQAADGEARSA